MTELTTDRRMSPRKTSLWMTLSCLALVAGCTPGEGESNFNPSVYLSQFDAPAPVALSVLRASFAGALGSDVIAGTAALFATDARYNNQSRFGWRNASNPNEPLNGRVYNPLRSSGAAFAHAAGVKGAGSTIAVSDEEYLPTYDEFVGSDVVIVNNYDNFPGAAIPTSHGTLVSAIALGDSDDYVGTAPDASLIFGSNQTEEKLAEVGFAANAANAVAWNNSWRYLELDLNQADFDELFTTFSGGVNYLDALDTYSQRGVVVFAVANNENAQHSGLMDGLPFLRPSLEAGWLAAANGVPTFSNGDVSDVKLLSSPCLEAARWCLIADGTWKLPDATLALAPGAAQITGSSFAAPQVSGALALLEQAFPGLSPHDLRVRLLASADDGFFTPDDTVELATGFNKGYSITYGHGFLDIEAALKPIGGTAMSLASGATVSTNSAVLRTGTGFGDAVEMSLAGTDVVVKDALSAGFVMPASALSSGARLGSRVNTLLSHDLTGDLAQERTASVSAMSDPFSAFGGSTMDLSARDGSMSASVLMPISGAQGVGFTVNRVLADGPTRVELGLKVARDGGQLLSLDGINEAMLASVSLGMAQDLGATGFVALSGEVGMTDLGGATAISAAGTARFDSAALKIGSRDVFTKGDRLTLGVALPMAVSSGERVLDLPIYRQVEGTSATAPTASFAPVAIDLAPENRQMDFEVGYQAALADGLEMKLSIIRSENYGNRAGAVDSGGSLAFTFSF